MKKLFLISTFFLLFLNCKAQQQIQPLDTDLENIIQGAYLKDINNDLNPFVGIYKANFNGRETTLYINKILHKANSFGQKSYFQDVLEVKYIVRNSSGQILQDTQNNAMNNNKIESINFVPQIQSLGFSYSGNNCHIGNGLIFMKKISANQISWTFNPQTTVIDDTTCPPSLDKHVYLPATKDLIFTKQ